MFVNIIPNIKFITISIVHVIIIKHIIQKYFYKSVYVSNLQSIRSGHLQVIPERVDAAPQVV